MMEAVGIAFTVIAFLMFLALLGLVVGTGVLRREMRKRDKEEKIDYFPDN